MVWDCYCSVLAVLYNGINADDNQLTKISGLKSPIPIPTANRCWVFLRIIISGSSFFCRKNIVQYQQIYWFHFSISNKSLLWFFPCTVYGTCCVRDQGLCWVRISDRNFSFDMRIMKSVWWWNRLFPMQDVRCRWLLGFREDIFTCDVLWSTENFDFNTPF
jgi:hypothetical protein